MNRSPSDCNAKISNPTKPPGEGGAPESKTTTSFGGDCAATMGTESAAAAVKRDAHWDSGNMLFDGIKIEGWKRNLA